MTRTDRATIEPLDLLARRVAGVLRAAVPPAHAGPPVADVRLHAAGEHLAALPGPRFILAGWVADYVALADGRRQIIALRLPGDFAGPLEPGVETSFLTMGRTIDGTALSRLRVESPGARSMSVAELLDGEEQVRLRQLVVRLGRCSAYERTAHLLLDLHERLLPVGQARPDGFHLPLTQEVLADALGLSIVHVNRTLQQLRREGRLVLRGAQAVFPDRDALAAAVHYTSRGPAPEARAATLARA